MNKSHTDVDLTDIAHSPLAESEREALRRHANEVDWALGVLIDSAVWNVERLEAQLAGAVDAIREHKRALMERFAETLGDPNDADLALWAVLDRLDAAGGQ